MIDSQTEPRWIAHDNDRIWGVGNSAINAQDDAKKWLNDQQALEKLVCVKSSETLYQKVLQYGGDCAFVITRPQSNTFEPFAMTVEEEE
jgi:hypothetical protein